MRQPSEKLLGLLESLQLCSGSELRSCEPLVRQLAQDLPDFDSVWVDALVLNGCLTTWQADILLSADPPALRVGEYLLESRLGASTWLARSPARRELCVLRRIGASDRSAAGPVMTGVHAEVLASLAEANTARADRRTGPANAAGRNPDGGWIPGYGDGVSRHGETLESLMSRLAEVRHRAPRSLALPDALIGDRSLGDCYFVGTAVGGWTADELLIRGGRLPPSAVAEIGRELLSALTWLESHHLIHGDIVLRNVRLTRPGAVRLVDPFVRWLSEPAVGLSDALTLRRIEGVAPELTGPARPADVRSELYAIGCLLWQLLTSRPVVLTADPVSRLVQTSQHDVPDPRMHVPDCPEWLARELISLTRRTPELRPAAAELVLKRWLDQVGTGFSSCRGLLRQMPDRQHRTHRPRRVSGNPNRRRLVTAAGMILIAGSLAGMRYGIIPRPLQFDVTQSLAADTSSVPVDNATISESLDTGNDSSDIIPIPRLTEDGVVVLRGGRSYVAISISAETDVVIRGDGGEPAVVLVPTETSWQLTARTLTLSNVVVRSASPPDLGPGITRSAAGATGPLSLIEAECDAIRLEHCLIRTRMAGQQETGIRWRSAGGSEPNVRIQNSVFCGGGQGLWLATLPDSLQFVNVLLATQSTPLRMDIEPKAGAEFLLQFDRVTQRYGDAVLDLAIRGGETGDVTCRVRCGECVFSPRTALIRLAGPDNWDPGSVRAEFTLPETGNPAVIRPEVARMIYLDRAIGHLVEAGPDQLLTDGLLFANPVFREPDDRAVDGTWSDSELSDFEGPKLSSVMPGVISDRLPADVRPPNNPKPSYDAGVDDSGAL